MAYLDNSYGERGGGKVKRVKGTGSTIVGAPSVHKERMVGENQVGTDLLGKDKDENLLDAYMGTDKEPKPWVYKNEMDPESPWYEELQEFPILEENDYTTKEGGSFMDWLGDKASGVGDWLKGKGDGRGREGGSGQTSEFDIMDSINNWDEEKMGISQQDLLEMITGGGMGRIAKVGSKIGRVYLSHKAAQEAAALARKSGAAAARKKWWQRTNLTQKQQKPEYKSYDPDAPGQYIEGGKESAKSFLDDLFESFKGKEF